MPKPQSASSFGVGSLLAVLTGLTMTLALYLAFILAPTDRVQGVAQRIVYVHAPVAWVTYLAFFVVFVCSIAYLVTRRMLWDRIGRASAEVGLIFTTLALITGSLWGRPIWGTWWTWDARLTTTLLLWFIYLGYFMIRAYAGELGRAARFSAVLGIIGFIDVPIIHMSVRWWRTLHPEPVVVRAEGPNMPNEMLAALMVSLVAFTLLYIYLTYTKYRIESAKDQIQEHRFSLAERDTAAIEGTAI